jgi:LPXTG-motif cell wall-anchored protein
VSAENFITRAHAKAYDITTLPGTKIGVQVTSELPTTIGTTNVTFTTENGTSITVQAEVFNTVSEENEEAINANNFAIALADVSVENFIARSNVKAYDIKTLPGAEIAVRVSSELPTTIGTANVTFTTENGTSITVQAEVYNIVSDENEEAINANNFAIALADVSEENFIVRSNAKAYDITTFPGAEIAVYMSTELPTTIGTADVTFTTDKGTNITVQVEVFNAVSDENKEAINANNFVVALADVSAENFIVRSNAKAYDINTLPGTEIAVHVGSELPTTIGTHVVTFATDKGTSMSVQVEVFNKVNHVEKEAMNASDFAIALRDVSAENFIARSHAKAYDITTLPAVEIAVQMTSELPTTTGNHAVTFTTVKGTSITVQVYVFDQVSDENQEAINAQDFIISLADAAEHDKVITFAQAVGYDLSNLTDVANNKVAITTINWTPELSGVGVYDVTFATAKGTSIQVKATVIETYITVEARDIILTVAEAKATNETDLLQRTAAKAETKSAGASASVSIAADEVEKITSVESGLQDASVITITGSDTTGDSIEAKVRVYIYDEVNDKNHEAINARDFVVALSDVSIESFMTQAQAKAYDITTLPGTEVPVKVTSKLPEAIGTYDVSFATAKGTTITVKVEVFNHVNDTNKEAMNAHDFAITLAEVSEEAFITKAGAKAYDVVAFPLLELTISVEGALPTTIGTHDVTFTTHSGTTMTVKAYIFTTIDETNKEAINAHDFEIMLGDVSEDNFVAKADAKAYSISRLPGAELTVFVSLPLPTSAGTYDVTFITARGTATTVKALVMNGEIEIKAQDVSFSSGEFTEFKQNNQLEGAILEKSKAKGYEVASGQEVTPLKVNLRDLMHVDMKPGQSHAVEIYYEYELSHHVGPQADDELMQTNEIGRASTTINVRIEDETVNEGAPLLPGLPITGEQVMEMLLIGMFILALSLCVLIISRRKREKEAQE